MQESNPGEQLLEVAKACRARGCPAGKGVWDRGWGICGVPWESREGKEVLEPECEQGGAGSFLRGEEGKDLSAQRSSRNPIHPFLPQNWV